MNGSIKHMVGRCQLVLLTLQVTQKLCVCTAWHCVYASELWEEAGYVILGSEPDVNGHMASGQLGVWAEWACTDLCI